jgi:type I restriction enzyme M protein
LTKALAKAKKAYAGPLGVNVVFVSDGSITEAYDLRTETPLRIDGDTITDILPERILLRFVQEGSDIYTPEKSTLTKRELIKVFADANDLLRKEGLREGVERFTEFSNLLFLKMISEIEADREQNGEQRIIDKKFCWDQFNKRDAQGMFDYINDTILPRLAGKYNHSGDVFQTSLLIKNPLTLKRIVDKLSELQLLDADSDIKGDAFEYFLKNSVTVGNDLGEFFTPRHIVKLIVDLVDPRFGETVYDPCCGTGGFLIEAFRHVKAKVKQTPTAIATLKEKTFYGRELTGTAKIAKMNMILTGDGHNNIKQMDSLENPVKGKYDVVLTNFPFSQQTDFGSYYGFTTDDANPIFLKHIIDALSKKGRAGVVVPDGLLYDEQGEYVKIRKILLTQCNLIAVIKLHNFVFRPFTGQPTSILIFEKGSATKSVWFFDVSEDGYKKSSSKRGRLSRKENDLPLLRQIWSEKSQTAQSWRASVRDIARHRYSLSADTYDPKVTRNRKFDEVALRTVADAELGKTPAKTDYNSERIGHKILKYRDIEDSGKINWNDDDEGWVRSTNGLREVQDGDVLLVASGHSSESIGTKAAFVKIPDGIPRPVYFVGELLRIRILRPDSKMLPSYLINYLLTPMGYKAIQRCVKGMHLTKGRAKEIKVVKAPFDAQTELMGRISTYQKTIDKCLSDIDSAERARVGVIAEFLQ